MSSNLGGMKFNGSNYDVVSQTRSVRTQKEMVMDIGSLHIDEKELKSIIK